MNDEECVKAKWFKVGYRKRKRRSSKSASGSADALSDESEYASWSVVHYFERLTKAGKFPAAVQRAIMERGIDWGAGVTVRDGESDSDSDSN